jgi:ketosteroid isomerase-like protein
MDLKSKIEDLNQMVLSGKALEAFDKYYADNVVMQENNQEPFVGKAFNRKREEEFFSSITELRGIEVTGVAVGDNVTMVEWFFDYTHKEWGEKKYHQVAVQRWENGQIVSERFYYGS